VEYCGAEGALGGDDEDTELIFGKRERALEVWSMNGLFESSAMMSNGRIDRKCRTAARIKIDSVPETGADTAETGSVK
jgi:hypothetical protein